MREEEAERRVVLLDVQEDFKHAQTVLSPGVCYRREAALVQQGVECGGTQNFLDFAKLGIEEGLLLSHLVSVAEELLGGL